MQINSWTYQFLNKNTFVLGNRKNAGKTTLMNLALNQIRQVDQPAFCTIGIDGESNDQIDGRVKPLIHTLPGDGIVTTFPMIQKSNGLFKIQKVFPYHTVLGQLVIATTIREGNIELVGPENNTQLNTIVKFLNTKLLFKTVIIDGAASRLTPLSAINNASFFYLLNIDQRNLSKSIDSMKLISMSAGFEKIDEDQLTDEWVIQGALTTSKLANIPAQCTSVVVNNLSSIFLSYQQVKTLNQQVKIKLQKTFWLNGFVVILKDIKEDEFLKLYQKNKIETALIFNPYVN